MKQGDPVWYYSPGPHGYKRQVGFVTGLHDSEDLERVNLHVFPLSSRDPAVSPGTYDAVPVRTDHVDGNPVATPFCTLRKCTEPIHGSGRLAAPAMFQGVPLPAPNVPPGATSGPKPKRVAKPAQQP